MRLSRILIALLVSVAVSPLVAEAQQPPSTTGGKVARIAPPPDPAAPANARARRHPAFFGNLPVVVLSDGRVFADFGRGFEQVVHSCGVPVSFDGQSSSLVQPTVVQPTVIQPSAAANPLPYAPPVPPQPTASQQMLPQATQQAQLAQASRSTLVNTQMCWSNDPRGRVFVGRP